MIKATLKSLGRVFKGEGSTLEECFNKMQMSGGSKVTSVLTVEKDGVTREKILNGAHTQHLFGKGSPTSKIIALKWVSTLFDI